jgi:hypothetical protein
MGSWTVRVLTLPRKFLLLHKDGMFNASGKRIGVEVGHKAALEAEAAAPHGVVKALDEEARLGNENGDGAHVLTNVGHAKVLAQTVEVRGGDFPERTRRPRVKAKNVQKVRVGVLDDERARQLGWLDAVTGKFDGAQAGGLMPRKRRLMPVGAAVAGPLLKSFEVFEGVEIQPPGDELTGMLFPLEELQEKIDGLLHGSDASCLNIGVSKSSPGGQRKSS